MSDSPASAHPMELVFKEAKESKVTTVKNNADVPLKVELECSDDERFRVFILSPNGEIAAHIGAKCLKKRHSRFQPKIKFQKYANVFCQEASSGVALSYLIYILKFSSKFNGFDTEPTPTVFFKTTSYGKSDSSTDRKEGEGSGNCFRKVGEHRCSETANLRAAARRKCSTPSRERAAQGRECPTQASYFEEDGEDDEGDGEDDDT
ncbi:hypothetical protein DdX_12806 [Ditylenchus destructor]|uniref:Uncharacterized protein n=1 Tax=Ditylenchus destructor TaxID=166010 RepID=A0AAD4N019_9BILA|nr:hypothetical protein DdX_12806 [Ditylenchus destructor]